MPFIATELNGIENRYSPQAAANDPEFVRDLAERANTYGRLKATNRHYALSQVSETSRDFFDSYDIHRRYFPQSSEDAALSFANRVVNPLGGRRQDLTFHRDETQQLIRRKMNSQNWVFSAEIDYVNGYTFEVENLAERLVAGGMNTSVAIEAAVERVFDNMVRYNDVPLPFLEAHNLPQDFTEIIDGMVEDYRTMDRRRMEHEGPIIPVHLGSGILTLHDRELNGAVLNEEGKPIYFDAQHLRELSNLRRQNADAEAIRRAQERHDRRIRQREIGQRLVSDPRGVINDEVVEPVTDAITDRVAPAVTGFGDTVRETLGRGAERIRQGVRGARDEAVARRREGRSILDR